MLLLNFPELRQMFDYDCGANALQSVFAYYGVEVREEILIKKLKTNKKIGTKIENIKKVAKDYGFKAEIKIMNADNIKEYIKKKTPVILLVQAWSGKELDYSKSKNNGHYVVAIGYDKNNFYFEDPYSIFRTYLSIKELNNRWHDIQTTKGSNKNVAIVVYGKKSNYNPKKIIKMA